MLGSACLWGEGQAPALGEPRVWRGEGGTASHREWSARLLAAPRTWRRWLRLAFHGVLSGGWPRALVRVYRVGAHGQGGGAFLEGGQTWQLGQ